MLFTTETRRLRRNALLIPVVLNFSVVSVSLW